MPRVCCMLVWLHPFKPCCTLFSWHFFDATMYTCSITLTDDLWCGSCHDCVTIRHSQHFRCRTFIDMSCLLPVHCIITRLITIKIEWNPYSVLSLSLMCFARGRIDIQRRISPLMHVPASNSVSGEAYDWLPLIVAWIHPYFCKIEYQSSSWTIRLLAISLSCWCYEIIQWQVLQHLDIF